MKGMEIRGGEDRSGGTIIPLIQQRERSSASCIALSSEQGRLRSPLSPFAFSMNIFSLIMNSSQT